jgi:hypothetical protein
VYEVQFPDGRTEKVAVNVIAQALYSQCDPDGNELVLLDSIIDWRKDASAVKLKDQARIDQTLYQRLGTLLRVASEPAFNWWVGWVIKKRDHIISLVKRRRAQYLKRHNKFVIELPKTVEEEAHFLGLCYQKGNA